MSNNSLTVLRWTAKIWSLVSLGFVLFFFVGYVLTPSEMLPTLGEWGEFVLFPIGVLVGMFFAWKREGIGSLISILSLLTFYLVEWNLKGRFPRGSFFMLLTAPAFLFLACYALKRLKKGERA